MKQQMIVHCSTTNCIFCMRLTGLVCQCLELVSSEVVFIAELCAPMAYLCLSCQSGTGAYAVTHFMHCFEPVGGLLLMRFDTLFL